MSKNKRIWDKWTRGAIYACDKHMDKNIRELKVGKGRIYCPFCGSWWKTHPKHGVMRHEVR